jgi:hypothetical protein
MAQKRRRNGTHASTAYTERRQAAPWIRIWRTNFRQNAVARLSDQSEAESREKGHRDLRVITGGIDAEFNGSSASFSILQALCC